MSKLVPRSTFRYRYFSLIAAVLLASLAIALAVSPSRSAAETVSARKLTQVQDSANTSGTIPKPNFLETLSSVNPFFVDVLAAWGFEGVTTTNTGTTPVISVGSPAADAGVQTGGSAFTAFHASASTVWSNPAGNASVKSVSSNNWAVGDYYQFSFSTSGYTAISITW